MTLICQRLMDTRTRISFSVILLALILCAKPVPGQDSLLVSGTISAGKGIPVAGVSVSIEGIRTTPAVTDSSGNFELLCPGGDLWLLVAPVAKYKSRRIYLNHRQQLNLQLTPVGMQSGYDQVGNLFSPELRRDLLSASNAPDPRETGAFPVQSIDQFFQGRIPGVWTTIKDGMPLSGATTYLRGVRSMFTTSQPLYIVDGQPVEDPGIFQSQLSGYSYNPLASIDPKDITNITILKDYLGGAIYGMKGSNGVILIETLQPTVVRTTIDFSLRTGFSMQPEALPQLNNLHYKTLANNVLMSSGLYEELYKDEYFPLYVTEDHPEYFKYNKNTNWQNEIFRNALINDYYLRISGGDAIARYGLSVGYMNHQGTINETFANRFNVRFVGSFNIFQWLRMYVSSNMMNGTSSLRESSLARETSPILTSLFKAPILHPYQYDEDGGELRTVEEVNSLGVSNPVSVIEHFEGASKNSRFANSFRMEADIIQDNLKWTSLFGITSNTLNESVFMPNAGMELYYDNEVHNASKSLKNLLKTVYSDNYLSFRQEYNNKHLVSAATGARLYMNTFEVDWGIGKNSHERDQYKQLQNGVSYLREMGGESSKWNRLGVYLSGGYSFRNKYFLNANLITEYSSRTGVNAVDVLTIGGEPFGLFYSLGGAWRLSEESFLKNLFWLEDLRIRTSYGKVGNDDIGNLSALIYYTVDHYRGTTGMIPSAITDQSVKFEVNTQLNTGLDLTMLGNRLSLAFDLYSIKTEDLLVFEPQEVFTGSATVPANNGEITNRGWEVGLNTRIFQRGAFNWNLGLNLSALRNIVDAIKDDGVITPFEGGQFISRVGEPVLSFYGYQYEGVYATSQEAAEANLRTEKGVYFSAGDSKFTDLSGPEGFPDGVINEYDRTIIGSPIPDMYGGFSNTFRYGRWALSANLQLVRGRDVYNFLRYQNERMTDLSNQSTSVLNRWVHEGQVTDVPRALYDDPLGNADFSSRWIDDGSYLRLKYLTLTYTVPEKKWFFTNIEAFVTATNLYTWSKYLGYDPEFSFSYYTMEQGIDYGMIPQTRRFMAGVRIGL